MLAYAIAIELDHHEGEEIEGEMGEEVEQFYGRVGT